MEPLPWWSLEPVPPPRRLQNKMQRRGIKRARSSSLDPSAWKRYKYTPAKKVATLAKKVNKLISEQERKNHDVSASATLVAATAQIIQLSSIPQGDDATSRDGRKVSFVSSQMRWTLLDTGTGTGGFFRVIVLHDAQSNGVSPVAADILTAPTNIRSPLTMDFKERFRVIYDNFCTVGKGDLDHPLVTVVISGWPHQYFARIKEDRAQAEFGGIGNILTSNSILMLVLSDNGGTFNYYHRLRFTDS